MVKNKKHICVIVSCLLAVMMAIMPFLTAKRQEITADAATSITSENPYIVFPSITLSYMGGHYIMPAMYLTYQSKADNYGKSNYYILYYCDSSDYDGYSTGYYDYISLYQPYIKYNPYSMFMYEPSDTASSQKISFHKLSTNTTKIYYSSDYTFEQIISLVNTVKYNIYGAGTKESPCVIGFDFVNSVNNDTLFSLTVYDVLPFPTRNSEAYFISPILYNVTHKDFADHIYDNGYSQGYSKGYKVGYNKGFNLTWSELSPWQALLNGIDDFVSAPLFGNVSLKLLFLVAFGCILFGLFIKTFFH